MSPKGPSTKGKRNQPHQYEYRLDGANCEWLPFDYGDPEGDITLAALVARQRDQLQVANYELQVENELLRERLANYEEHPGKGSSSIPIQSEVDDYQITTTVNSQNLQVSRAAEIEQYLTEHWECLRASADNEGGLRSMPAMIEHYAQDLDKFARDQRFHPGDHEARKSPLDMGEETAEARDLWAKMAALLVARPQVTDQVWDAWLGPVVARMAQDGALVLRVPTAYNLEWLERRLWDDLVASYTSAGGAAYLRIVVASDAAAQ